MYIISSSSFDTAKTGGIQVRVFAHASMHMAAAGLIMRVHTYYLC